MNTTHQIFNVSGSLAARKALVTAGACALTFALGIGVSAAQMTPAQPAPAPTAPTAQPTSGPNDIMFKRIDSDGDGYLSKSELTKADANLARDFDKYDTDKDGKLSMPEFEAMLKMIRG